MATMVYVYSDDAEEAAELMAGLCATDLIVALRDGKPIECLGRGGRYMVRAIPNSPVSDPGE